MATARRRPVPRDHGGILGGGVCGQLTYDGVLPGYHVVCLCVLLLVVLFGWSEFLGF